MLQTHDRMTADELATRLEGVHPHHLPRHRGTQHGGDTGVRRARPRRRVPPGRRLPHPADRPDPPGGRSALPHRPARPRPTASVSGAAAATTQLKLLAALPAELRAHTDRQRQRFHLDVSSWYHDAEPTPHLPAVADAVWRQHRIRIHYQRWATPHDVTRTVEPHGVVLKAGHWYLVARRAGRFRTYRVARILDTTMLDQHFDRTEHFDLAEYWRTYLDDFDTRRHQDQAVLLLSQEGMRLRHSSPSPPSPTRPRRPARPNRMDGPASPSRSNPTTRPSTTCSGSARTPRSLPRADYVPAWPTPWPPCSAVTVLRPRLSGRAPCGGDRRACR